MLANLFFTAFKINAINNYKLYSLNKKPKEESKKADSTYGKLAQLLTVSGNLALVSFYGIIKPAKRLEKSDYKIASYIGEISKSTVLLREQCGCRLINGQPRFDTA